MRNSIKKSFIALALAGTLGGAIAVPVMAAPDSTDSGFFVSGQVGRSRFDIGNDGRGADFGKKNATIGGVGIGYAFNPIIAVELSYNNYGKVILAVWRAKPSRRNCPQYCRHQSPTRFQFMVDSVCRIPTAR